MLEWDKGKEDVVKPSSSYVQEMEEKMQNICRALSAESKGFIAKDFFYEVNVYIKQKDRLLYTYLTNHIFTLNEEKFGKMQTNIDNVVNYMYSDEFNQDFSVRLKDKNEKKELERTQRAILKIWDHVNLARRQYLMFNKNDDEYAKIVDEKMEIAKEKISKEVSAQLISLVAIFTALSFLVFGGMTSLDNIFSGVKDIPILKLVIIGLIWCFCILNLVFSFMFFVSKLTGLSLKSTEDLNANIVQKYPLVCWCNYIMVFLLILVCWYYYIRCNNYHIQINTWISKHSTLFSVISLVLIICALYFVARKLYIIWKKPK